MKRTSTKKQRRRILVKVKCSHLSGEKSEKGTYIIYRDGTYRLNTWQKGDLSSWRIKDDCFEFRHRGDPDFERDTNEEDQLVYIINKAIIDLEFEKLVLR